ncbi:MAG: FAD-binding oxidoreductase [Cellvibrionaceae bacterium]
MPNYNRRWNAWGHADSPYLTSLSEGGRQALGLLVGDAEPLKDTDLESVLATVPPSRLPQHPLIRTNPEDRLRHARGQSLPDWMDLRSGNIDVFPDGVAFPKSSAEVRELLDFAKDKDIDVIPYGGGTSVVGHINPLSSDRAVLTIDMAEMDQLLAFDEDSQLATFGAGTPGPKLEQQLQERGYTLGHYPQSWELSTVGGWVASRSSGQQSLRYGRIEQMFAGGRIETLQGTMNIPAIPASSAGPDLREIFMGTEGRMGILTEVQVRVTPLPERESFHVAFLPNWHDGVATLRTMAQKKLQLSMLRLSNLMETITMLYSSSDTEATAALNESMSAAGLDDNKVMLTFGVTGSAEQYQAALEQAKTVIAEMGGHLAPDTMGEHWAKGRFGAPYWRETLWEAGYAVDTMETAVNWDKVIDTVATIESSIANRAQELDGKVHAYTHLSHVYGQGCSVYSTYIFACRESFEATHAHWQQLKAAGAQATVNQGGTISHQHGVGFDHKNYLPNEKGELGIAAIAHLLSLFDPDGRMNPGKLLP